MARFFVVFVALLAVLFLLELTPVVAGILRRAVDERARRDLRRRSSRCSIPASSRRGKVIRSTANGFAVAIEAGCNGVEATIVLCAAILAFPAPWRYKALIGSSIGVAAVQLLNVVRVISLFYIGQWNRDAFEWAHLYVWQALIMLDVLVVWLIWVRRIPRDRARRARRRAGAVGPRLAAWPRARFRASCCWCSRGCRSRSPRGTCWRR